MSLRANGDPTLVKSRHGTREAAAPKPQDVRRNHAEAARGLKPCEAVGLPAAHSARLICRN